MRRLFTFVLLLGCGPSQSTPTRPAAPLADAGAAGVRAITADALRRHVLHLSSDALEGRATGSRGHAEAAAYVAEQLRAIGLAPAGERGGFFQEVPLREMTRIDAGCALEVDGRALPGDDVVFAPFAGRERIEVAGPLVYVGFGLAAPEQRHDDLGSIDLRGKIAVVLRGAPPSFRPATARALHSDLERKGRRLAAAGAVALIAVHTPEAEALRSWALRRGDARFPSMTWLDGERPGTGHGLPMASVSMAGFQALLGATDAGALWTEATAGRAIARPLGRAARLRIASTFRALRSPNVAAVLRGGDPALAGEHVVISAHLDHLGVGEARDGDAIYNGALDNGTGVAALIEIARGFAALPTRPPRSVLFLAVTAEEKGLLGSDYFAAHPTVPLGSIVADVNLDMLTPMYEMFDVVPLGADHSSLARNAAEAAAALGVAVSEDPSPEQVSFIRSDQYSFVKRGVPSLFPGAGHRDATGATAPNRALAAAWLRRHYHEVSDEWRDAEHGAANLAKEVRLYFLIALSIARDAARPTWNPGDVLGEMFGRPR